MLSPTSKKMRQKWNDLSNTNQMHFIASSKENWDETDFFKYGRAWFDSYNLLEYLENELKINSKGVCLEIGCGIGRMTFWLAKYFNKVIAIDVSDKMINVAKTYQNKFKLSNVDFQLTDGKSFPQVMDNSIDFIFSYITFRHIPNRNVVKEYLFESIRVLKNGGALFIEIAWDENILFSFNSSKIIKERINSFSKKIPIIKYQRYNCFNGVRISKMQMAKILNNCGFTTVDFLNLDKNSHDYFVLAFK